MRSPEIYVTETNHEVSLRNPTSKQTQQANEPSKRTKLQIRKNAIFRFHLCYQGLQT